jgi:hypothetical protein
MVLHACNPRTQERLRQENHKIEASWGYIVRPYLKTKKVINDFKIKAEQWNKKIV